MQVLISRDGVWRVEIRAGSCAVYMYGGKVLDRVSLDRAIGYLIDRGVDPERDLIEG